MHSLRFSRVLLGLTLALIVPLTMQAVDVEPHVVPVGFSCKVSGTANVVFNVYDATIAGFSGQLSAGESNNYTAWLKPGKEYWVDFQISNSIDHWLSFTAPSGYRLYINGLPKDHVVRLAGSSSQAYFPIELRPILGAGFLDAGVFTGIDIGQAVAWELGAGGLVSGHSVGRIGFRELDLSNSPASRARLLYTAPLVPAGREQVNVICDGPSYQVLRQIASPQKVLDFVDDVSNGYWIKYYNYDDTDYTGGMYVPKAGKTPWRQIRVESPAADQLKISEIEGSATRVSSLSLTSGSVPSGTYVWTLQEGDGTTWLRTTTHTSIKTGAVRENVVTVRTGGTSGTIVSETKYIYNTYGWGEDLYQIVANPNGGSGATLTTTYTYHETAPSSGSETYRGSYRRVKSVTGPDGGWAAYEYYDDWNRRGQTKYQYQPFQDTPASVTLDPSQGRVQYFEYVQDPNTGRYSRPSLKEEKTGNVTTAKTVWTYDNSANAGLLRIKADVDSYRDSSAYHRTHVESIDPASGDVNEEGEPYVVKNANCSQTSWSRIEGSYNSSTKVFTVGSLYYWRELKVNGSSSSSGADAVTSYDSQSFAQIYLLPNKSTIEVTIRNVAGYVVRTETRVYTGSGSWSAPINAVDSVYNAQCRPTSSTALNGAAGTYTYTNGYVSSVIGGDGVETQYTYDSLGRTLTSKKVGVSASGSYAAQADITTTNTYDGANRVTSEVVSAGGTSETITASKAYDLAGRLTSQTPPGLGATTMSYNLSARSVTTTAPDGGTTIQAHYLDGQAKSVSGTAAVAQYYTYGVESDGRRYTRVDTGVTSSSRWAKAWTDWVGRPIESRSPGFSVSSQADSVTQNYYESGTGNLIKTTKTGYAPILYVYDTLGMLTRSGLDVDNGGALVLASMDRITDSDASFESYSSALWLKQTTTIYPLANSSTAFTAAISRARLTGFSGSLRAEAQSTDAEGNTSTSTTSVSGKTVTTTATAPGMANVATSVAYNGLNVGSTGFDGLTSLAQYDALGRAWKSTDPRGIVTSNAYYSNTALLYTVTDGASNVLTTYGYDTSGRVTSQTDGLGAVARTTYNYRGAVTNQWGTGTYPVSYAYDATYGDRTSMSTYRGGSGWDGSSWPTATTGTADTTTWTMDTSTALLWKKTDAAGKIVEFDYNARGQAASRKWHRTLTSSSTKVTAAYGYDGATGELLTTTYNDSGEAIPTPGITYTYTRSGQVATVVDAAGTRSFSYQSGAPWRADYEDLPAFFGSRRLTRLYESASGTSGSFNGYTMGTVKGRSIGFDLGVSGNQARDLHQQYTASSLGRFVGVTGQAAGGTAQDFVYAYESGARLLDGYTAGSFSVSRDYESNRDLTSRLEAKWSTTSLTRFDYTHNARYERITAKQSGTAYADYYSGTGYSSVFNVYGYNTRGELQTSAMYRGDTASSSPSSADELPGRRFEYRYDAIGNRVTAGATGSAGTSDDEYTANSLNQYTQKENNLVRFFGTKAGSATVAVPGVTVGTKDRTWAADFVPANTAGPAQGTASIYAALVGGGSGGADLIRTDSKAWFTPQWQQTLTYDDDGNLVSDGVFTYTWNAENQLVRATSALPTGSGFTRLRLDFKYDYTGRRIEKRVTDLSTSTETLARRFVYDGWNLVAEIDGSGSAIQRSYAWGLDLTGDFTKAGGIGALLRMTNYSSGTPGASYYPTYDGNGNVTVVVNASSGAIAAVYEYDAYGNYIRNEVIDSAVADNPFRFSTKYTDSETGWAYYGHRYYSATLGRFINKDPIEEGGGLNLYAFCGNNGVNKWDYLGMDADADYRNMMALDVPENVRTMVQYMRNTYGQWRFPGIQYDANLNNVWVQSFSDVTGETNFVRAGMAIDHNQVVADNKAYEQQQAESKGQPPPFQGTPGRDGKDSSDVQVKLPTYVVDGGLDPAIVEMINAGQLAGAAYGAQAPNSGLSNGDGDATSGKSGFLFEKGKRYINVYDSKELDRGVKGYRIGDRESTHDRPKFSGFELDLYDVSNPDAAKLSGKYDGIVYSQHGALTANGFATPSVADAFLAVAPSLKSYLRENAWVAWDHCYGGANQQALTSMKSSMGVGFIYVPTAGLMTGFKAYYGPFVDGGAPWIRK